MANRMTYRDLREYMQSWSEWELDCDLTVKDIDEDECYAAFVERGATHGSLDEDHPVVSFSRTIDIEHIVE